MTINPKWIAQQAGFLWVLVGVVLLGMDFWIAGMLAVTVGVWTIHGINE